MSKVMMDIHHCNPPNEHRTVASRWAFVLAKLSKVKFEGGNIRQP
jgi:hypothetical protein